MGGEGWREDQCRVSCVEEDMTTSEFPIPSYDSISGILTFTDSISRFPPFWTLHRQRIIRRGIRLCRRVMKNHCSDLGITRYQQ
jgi:hypothetical protein